MPRTMVDLPIRYLLLILGTPFVLEPGEGATDSFVPPTAPNRQCFCPGDMENYTCNVSGGLITEWRGTSFSCPLFGNAIRLIHSLYELGTASEECNNGAIRGVGTSVDTSVSPTCYTSELSITINSSMNGQTVQCFRNDQQDMIGNHTLRVAAPPLPPINVTVTEIDLSTFTVIWIEPTSDCGTVFFYEISSDCGGSCLVSSSTSGECSGWTAAGQTCLVMVRAALCAGQSGSYSTSVMLNLEEPSFASDISGLAMYSDDILNSLIVTFPIVSPVEVAPGLYPAVTYTVQTVGVPQVVPINNCNATLCQYQIKFASDNPPSNDFSVTVTVSNGIGGGQSATPFQVPAHISSLVTLTAFVMGSNAIVSAFLPSGFQNSTNLIVTYGIMPICDNNTVISANSMANDTLTVTLTSIQPRTKYCYSVVVSQEGLTFEVMGEFRSECNVDDLSSGSVELTSQMCPSDDFANSITINNGRVCYTGTVPGAQHTAEPLCNQGYQLSSSSSPSRVCQSNGIWNGTVSQCEAIIVQFPGWAVPVIICAAVLFFSIGIIVGILLTLVCGIFVHGIQQRKGCTLLLVILLSFLFGFGIGILIGYCCVKNKKEKDDKEHLESQEINSPPLADSLYADPKSIEHQAAPGTEDQYAMVDRKAKKNTKPKPTPPEALYQDPSTIEHETAASGVMYTLMDKPKRSSKKEGGPDVVPPASEGSTGKLVEEATKPNSSQLPQELYSEVFNALPKGMAPKVVRNGTKN